MRLKSIMAEVAAAALLAESQQVKKNEEIALKNFEIPEVMPSIDEIIRKEKKDRRQQHKYAVKYSNRKK